MHKTTLIAIGCMGFIAPLIAQQYQGCEVRPEVLHGMHELDSSTFSQMKWTEKQAMRERVLNGLMARFPREIAPHIDAINNARWTNNPARWKALQKRYRDMAAAHPDDALALVLASKALFQFDTPESVRLAEAAHAKAPNFPYPLLMLAVIYSQGLRAEPARFAHNLQAYFALCPTATEHEAMWLLPKLPDSSIQSGLATALRKRLANETDPLRLAGYEDLWSLEFRATPPAKHDVLRKQVTEDVKRLEALNPRPDEQYFNLLRTGYKQSGVSPDVVTAFENRILREAPGSSPAYSVTYQRWKKGNKEPEGQTDRAAWRAHNAKLLAKLNVWDRQYPAVGLGSWRLYLMFDDENLAEKDGVAALEEQLAHDREYEEPDAGTLVNYAEMLVDKKWRLEHALALLDEARPLAVEGENRWIGSDNLDPEQRWDGMGQVYYIRYEIANKTLKAALLLHRPEAAEAARPRIEAPLPADARRSNPSRYWHGRALLAMVDQHQADALSYFQKALQLRPESPKMYRGKLEDPLMDDAKDLWKQLGGTETAFAQWSAPPTAAAGGSPTEQKQGSWEKPKKTLPSFELTDLSGKTWKLKSFEGKTVLINLWATWCGPCQAELPEFQKLYEKVKDRPDLQIVSFNIDSELGLVAPFMKEKGYTFPAIIAYDFTRKLLDGIGIPQNWIIDKEGKWELSQLGFGAEPDWPGEMIKRMESIKP